MQIGGHPFFMRSNLKNQENIVWVHPRYATSSQTDVEELTRIEFLGRERMLLTHEFYKRHIPGFENSFIVLSDPQLGTRGSRRVHGDYMITSKALLSNEPFEDTIAVFPDLDRGEASLAHPNTFIPYRALLPKGIENMLVACRASIHPNTKKAHKNLLRCTRRRCLGSEFRRSERNCRSDVVCPATESTVPHPPWAFPVAGKGSLEKRHDRYMG
jgi:hypothetical protein